MALKNFFAGIVRSPVSATLPQIASRIFVTWGILWSFPEVCGKIGNVFQCISSGGNLNVPETLPNVLQTRGHWLVVSLILSWGLTEVGRSSPPFVRVLAYFVIDMLKDCEGL